MNGSTNPKNEVRLVPKKEYYGMGERELKESMKSSKIGAQSNPDQLMKDRHETNYSRAQLMYHENKGKINSGLTTKNPSEVIKKGLEMKAKSAKNMRITNSKRITPISVNKNTSRVEYKENTGNPKDQLWKNSSAAMKSKILEAQVQTIYSSSKKNKKR